MPRPPKPPHMRQNTERRDVGAVPDAPDQPLAVPTGRSGWLKSTRDSWERFWTSPGRHITVQSLDLDRLERLWILYDERERAYRELKKARVVEGSQGQMRASPFYTVIARLDAEIRQLEDGGGKSARSRLNLGMVVGSGERTDDRGDESEPGGRAFDEVEDDGPSEDPRLYVLDGRAG